MFFVAVVVGTAVTALVTIALMSVGEGAVGASATAGGTATAGGAAGGAGVVGAEGGGSGAPSVVGEPVLAEVGGGGRAGEASGAAGGAPGEAAGGAAGARKAVAPQGVAAETGEVEAVPAGQVLSGYLTEQTVKERLAADGKDAAIREMAELLAATGKVADTAELVRAAFAREDQGTTGLGEEIAIPHAKTDAVTAPVVGFARSPEGIEWGAPDGTKARLVFMIAVPEADAGDEHLRILALLSRKLMGVEFRERLLGRGMWGRYWGCLGRLGRGLGWVSPHPAPSRNRGQAPGPPPGLRPGPRFGPVPGPGPSAPPQTPVRGSARTPARVLRPRPRFGAPPGPQPECSAPGPSPDALPRLPGAQGPRLGPGLGIPPPGPT
ncbi:hypothetical protein SVIO_048000 [Streptomyces violaceusniger]|uniref:PTS EIIA type-2 domain-containing protein n=1 Tax=Streptomyces violaceusniger TaxID=68280 RepID=A0A4D4L694_STRVO|nr:hypothetical protein SVIO_048000 [Streptomyces violaceusniger]